MLGQVADGYGVDDLQVGAEVELVVEPLYTDETGDRHDLALEAGRRAGRGGRPVSSTTSPSSASACTRGASGAARSSSTACTRPARRSADAGIAWSDVDLVVGGETVRNGYAGYVAGATFAQALGWNGARVATSYAACATGAQALDTARARILAGLCEVALVVGADTTPKGFLAPERRRAVGRPRLAAVPAARHDQPGVLRALRAPPDGPLRRDAGGLRRR